MIISPDDWPNLWEVVEDDFRDSTEKGLAVLFSTQEVETVCAVKMLQLALSNRDVPFSVYPVEHYTDLQHTLAVLLDGSDQPRTVLLINCGASSFIQDLAPPSAAAVRYIVIDSHRPVHPRYNDNNDSERFLVLAGDDPLQLEAVPPHCELDELTDEDREQLRAAAEEEQEREDQADEDDEEPEDSPAKRARLEAEGDSPGTNKRYYRERYRRLRERERQLEAYMAMGSSFGKPTPLLLMPLAEQLMDRLDNQLLWPAAVGLTDQWVHQRLSRQQYSSWYSGLREAVRANDTNRAAAEAAANNSGVTPLYVQASITVDRELRLMLYRHWNLFDAFCYSSYVAPRLQTWRTGGQEAVSLLFVHMGISQEQAKTAWKSMHSRAKQHFKQKLRDALTDTNLSYGELAVDGFCLRHNREETAASDVVHACTALLTEHTLHEAPQSTKAASGFWAAVEALDCSKQEGLAQLRRGIEMAKLMQQAIIKDGGIMTVDRRLLINPAAHMQELLLNTLAPTNAREFRHPLTLLRLAYFVRDATKVARSGAQLRACHFPILVVGPEDGRGFCLVIGLRAKELAGDVLQYNIFGHTFQSILNHPDSVTNWDRERTCFDNAVVYVHKDTVQNFCADVREVLLRAKLDAEEAERQEQQRRQREQQQEDGRQEGQQAEGQQQQRPRRRRQRDADGAEAGGSGAGDVGAADAGGDGDDADFLEVSAAEDDDGGGDAAETGGGGDPAEVVMASEDEEEQNDDDDILAGSGS